MDIAPSSRPALRRRLRPLHVATVLQGVMLWVPIEKLFMNQIGFTAASVGMVAAAYAVVVPFLEIPSGILADRWSRRGVLVVANLALAVSVLAGGLSTGVATYLVSAALLGVYLALQSGTADSIIYDTLVEETGHADGFERALGRLRLWESAALVVSALAGAGLAALTEARVAYFATVPFVVASAWALRSFREPRLHNTEEPTPIRAQVSATYRTLLQRGPLRGVVVAMVVAAMLTQVLLEFSPLWLVAFAAPTVLFGPQWAGLMSALGLGGVAADRVRLTSAPTLTAVIATMLACSATLALTGNAFAVLVAQVGLALLLVLVSTSLTRLLHDQIPSAIRAGVSSGVSTLTWLTFLPFAIVLGIVSADAGIHAAGWMVVAATALLSAALVHLAVRSQSAEPTGPGNRPGPEPVAPALVDA